MSVIKVLLWSAAVLALVTADRPAWRKIEGDLIPDLGDGIVRLQQEVDESYRLPETISVPTHYNIHLRTGIHQNDRQYQGQVEVFITILQETEYITMHNRGLVIHRVTAYKVDDPAQDPVELGNPEFTTDNTRELLSIKCCAVAQPGNYMLKLEYFGVLQDNTNRGFFASSYLGDDGRRHYLASSKFEPTHARSAFPCYDEPQLKSTFTLSITHHKDYHAVSNMPQDGEVIPDEDDASLVLTRFQKSTRMSTYLLAFAVTDYAVRSNLTQDVYARPNAYNETEFPLAAGETIMSYLEFYVGIRYDKYMPKMSQIAIPDRGTGAMENWGLVAYGEPVLLFNPEINTYRNKKSITTIIAHEYAHQWFGNLVSPQWWSYIWLNEGFATLLGHLGADLAYPDDQYWQLWNVEVVHNAFIADGQESVRPMTWNVATPDQIAGLFDTIAYDKAGSVLNMFRFAFGEDNWRLGVFAYLNARELDAATADHLHEGLQMTVSDQDVLPRSFTVKQVMDSWTTEPGYPLLTIRRDYKSGAIYLSQERFLNDKQLPNAHVYYVPYNYATKSSPLFNTNQFEWLLTKAIKLETTIAPDDWIIFNNQQTGYYRVNYDDDNWRLIITALKSSPATIHMQNRAQLVNDAFNLARGGRLDMAVALELLSYIRQELDYPPWAAANSVLTYFYNKLRGTDYYADFTVFVRNMIDTAYSAISVDSVSETNNLLQNYHKQLISTWACRMGVEDCLSRTAVALQQAAQDNKKVHPDIASVIYCDGLRTAGEKEFVWLFDQLVASDNEAERTVLIDALGCTENKEFLGALLMVATGADSDTFNFLGSQRNRIVTAVYSGSQVGVEAMTEYLKNDTLIGGFVSRLGRGTLQNVVGNIAARTNTQPALQSLNALLEALGDKIDASAAASARTVAAKNLAWFDTLEGLVATEFFEKRALNQ